MKKYLLSLAIAFLCIAHLAAASDPAYEAAMKKQISEMRTIQSATQSREVSNGFVRIAEAMPQEWLPIYYAAYVQATAAFRFEVDKDQYFDQALEWVKKAEKISPNNSEITALHGFILMGKVSVDPTSRGQSLSPQVMQLFGKAIGLDRENPRATTLMAQMELGMAQFFGSGPEKACGMARVGLDLFAKEETKLTENYLLPIWGKDQAARVAEQCK